MAHGFSQGIHYPASSAGFCEFQCSSPANTNPCPGSSGNGLTPQIGRIGPQSGHGGAVDDDVVARWNAQRAGNRRVTLIDLYAMAAGPRGLAPHELPAEERRALTEQAMGIIVPGHETIPGSDTTHQPIAVVAADPEWRTRFEGYRAQLASVLGPVARRIEHVGSTSVQGLDAQPVIDVQISVRDIADEGAYVPAIERIGIQFRSRDDERRYFRPAPPRPRDAHVHVCVEGSAWERDHLLYRDYLRTHTDARKR